MIIPTHAELTAAMCQSAWIEESEIAVLCHYAAKAQRVVEIGCAFGGSSTLFLLNIPDGGHVSSVDAFVPDSYGGWSANLADCATAVYCALVAFGRPLAFAAWSLIPHTSEYVVTRWQAPSPIDLLFIDGSHFEEDVQFDWNHWTPFVRQGGIVMLHDSRKIPGAPDNPFPRGYDGPTKLADRLRGESSYKLLEEVFSLTVWEKL